MPRKPSYIGETGDFPRRLKRVMAEHRENQTALAAVIGMQRQTVGYYLSGRNSPDWETIVKIAKHYEVSTDWLLGLSDVRSTEASLKAACEYTGLSENVIELIRNNSKVQLVLNQGIEYKDAFLTFLDQLYYCYHEAYNLNRPEPVRVRGDGFQYFQGSLMRSVIELRVSSSAVALADQLMSKELVSEYGYIVYQENPMPFGPNGDRYQIEGGRGINGNNQAD